MNYKLHLTKENYIKDFKKYLFYSRRKEWYLPIGILMLCIVIFICSLIINSKFDIKGIAFILGILGGTLLLFELSLTYKALKSINESSKKFKFNTENLIIEPTQIKLSHGKIRYQTVYFTQIRKCLILSDTIFLILKTKEQWPTRINKSEISNEGFSSLIDNFKNRNIIIEHK